MAKSKAESIRVYLSNNEKHSITRIAGLEGKTISEFVRTLTLAKAGNSDPDKLIELQKGQYVLTRLMLYLGSQGVGAEQIMEYYHTCLKDVEEKFGRE
jgi:uncharacterized protein (DUF1778 family)